MNDLDTTPTGADPQVRARVTAALHRSNRDPVYLDAARAAMDRYVAAPGADRLDTLDALWSPDIGRQLLTRRSATPGWREADAAEYRGILEAVDAGDPDEAAARMERHVAARHEHWAGEVAAEREAEEVDA